VEQRPARTPRVLRLKTRAQFQAVMAGKTISRTRHFALHQLRTSPAAPSKDPPPSPGQADLSTDGELLLGAVIPKRWARRAVTRNTIKRQIFAVAADFAALLPRTAHVVRLRSGFDRARFTSATSEQLRHAVRAELQALFSEAARC